MYVIRLENNPFQLTFCFVWPADQRILLTTVSTMSSKAHLDYTDKM